MATQNLTDGPHGYTLYNPVSPTHVVEKVVELGKITAGASDVLQTLNIPANSIVTAVRVKVITPSGGVLTATVGDGGSPAVFGSAIDLNNTATDVFYTGQGRPYTVNDTLDVTLSNNAPGTVGVFSVQAVFVTLS